MNRILIAAAVALAACSDGGSGGGTPSPSVDRADAVDAANASADETQQAVDAIAGTSSALSPQGLRAGLMSLAIPERQLCATVSSDVDSDGDGTIDDGVYTYALPACALSQFRGGTLELTGAIRVSDPDPAPGYAYRLEYQDFSWHMAYADTARSFTTRRNGTRTLALENGTLVLASALTMRRAFGTRGEASIGSEVRSVFTPAGDLAFGRPLPGGSITQDGAVTMTRNGTTERYTVETVTPLRIETTCAAYPRISEGEVRYVLQDRTYVRVRWPGCGQAALVDAVEGGQ